MDWIHNFVGKDNEFFKGGLLLAVFGFAASWLRSLPGLVVNYVRIRLIHTLRVDSEEGTLFEAFKRLLNSPEAEVKTRTFRLVYDDGYRDRGGEPLEGIQRQFNADFFVFRFAGFTYYVDFEEGKPENGRFRSHFVYRVSAYWRAKAAMERLTQALAERLEAKSPDQLELYSRNEGYFQHTLVPKRSLQSLYYEPELLDELLADLHGFLEGRDWYKRLGIPYRRGYLLYGEPGTGKTSLIKGVASLLDKPLYVLGEATVEVTGLRGVFNDIPAGSIVVIEDFDRLLMKSQSAEGASKLSMGTLLNQLDGLEAKEGLMVFITANHREVFDAALERPGRIDRKFYVGHMSWAGASKMFANFYGPEHLGQFEQVWLDGLFTPAQLQVYFSKYKHDPKTAVARFGNLLREIGEGLEAAPQ